MTFSLKFQLATIRTYKKILNKLAKLDQELMQARWRAIFKAAYEMDDIQEADLALAEKTRLKAMNMKNEAEKRAVERRKALEESIG